MRKKREYKFRQEQILRQFIDALRATLDKRPLYAADESVIEFPEFPPRMRTPTRGSQW